MNTYTARDMCCYCVVSIRQNIISRCLYENPWPKCPGRSDRDVGTGRCVCGFDERLKQYVIKFAIGKISEEQIRISWNCSGHNRFDQGDLEGIQGQCATKMSPLRISILASRREYCVSWLLDGATNRFVMHPSMLQTVWLRNSSSDRPSRFPTSSLMMWITLRVMELALLLEIRSIWRN